MGFIVMPKGFLHFSNAVTTILVLSWWVDFELAAVHLGNSGWPVLEIVVLLDQVVLLTIGGTACIGMGVGCGLLGLKCLRSPSRIRSRSVIIRYGLSLASVSLALLVVTGTLLICNSSMESINLVSGLLLFTGLQVSEIVIWRRILRWRVFRRKVSV